MTMERILVVDDEPEIRRLVQEILEDEQYEVVTAKDAASAREAYSNQHPDLVLLDIWMPDTDGISLLKEWSHGGPLVPVVIMSGHGTVDTAVEATRLGAVDFVEKPLSMGKLLATVERALQDTATQRAQSQQHRVPPISVLAGKSAVMRKLRDDIERIAATDSWVLITGEPGSGKVVAARYLHQKSARGRSPLLEISFAAVPAKDLIAQLFGHQKGREVSPGTLEQVNGGTLLLHEITDLELATQARLLSALGDRRLVRVGGGKPVALDVRVIATSNQDVEKALREGRLREDLYYRVNVVPLYVPALRQHREDVPELINYYRDWMVEHQNLPYRKLSTAAMNKLRNYTWPGNVRELRNMVQRLLVLNADGEVTEAEVERALGSELAVEAPLPETQFNLPLRDARDQFEKAYLEYHLKRTHGNVSELAHVADMERTHLYRKLKSLGIDPKSVRTK
ncbi:MAG: sigma-54-dependent transcriptional regulator [Acidiferrobacterales bacterium]